MSHNQRSDHPILPFKTITAAELLKKKLPPVRMVVGNIIPAGLLLLAGDPKVGKSLIVQDLALSVSLGEPAWGSLHIDAGDALYIANEGGERSFGARLEKMLGGRDAPVRFAITETKEALGERLEVQIEWWLSSVKEPRLVVIDTYASVAPEGRGINRHQDDYNALAGLADLAARWPDTLFIVVHHTRKAEGEDVMHKISGSQGMTAATDGNAVLTRQIGSGQCLLSIRPRNAEESDLVMERDNETLRWHVVGVDERCQLSAGRQRILEWFDAHPAGGSPAIICEALPELSSENVRQYLSEMTTARQIHRTKRGWYTNTTDKAA